MLLAWLLLTTGAWAEEPAWARHGVPGQVVSLELPGAVEHRHSERRMIIGTVVSETLVVEWQNGWAAATVTTIPTLASAMATEGNIFGTTRKNVLSEHEATLETWADVTRDGLVGKRMTYASAKDGPRRGVSEIFTWDDKVATITTVFDPGTAPPGHVERLFRSIRIARTP